MSFIQADPQPSRPKAMHFVDTSSSPQFRNSLMELQRNQELTDVSFKVNGVVLPCHRVVLAAASPYFRAMFTSGFEESASATVEIKSTDHVTLQHVVDYVYSAEIDITPTNVQNLFQICCEYQLESLQHACEKYMLEHVDSENCIGLLRLANLFDLDALRKGAKDVMLKNFQAVAPSAEFTEMTEAELVQYISDPEISVTNEDAVFEAVTVWVNFNLPDRKAAFKRVLAHVRLPFCTASYLWQVVEKHPLLTSECQQYLQEARQFQSMPESQHEMFTPRTIPRRSFGIQRRLFIVGNEVTEGDPSDGCWYLDEMTNTWVLLTYLPEDYHANDCYSICLTRNGLVLTGGGYKIMMANGVNDETVVTANSWLFSTVDQRWVQIDYLRVPRCNHSAVALCDHVYAVGGEDKQGQPLSSVECLDTKTWKWSEISPMKQAVTEPMAVSFRHSIYVFGGEAPDGNVQTRASTSTQVFDRVWGKWIMKANMPNACTGGAAVTVNDLVFLVGGVKRTCMSYNPALDTWTALTSPVYQHRRSPVVVWKGKILIAGGDYVNNGRDIMAEI